MQPDDTDRRRIGYLALAIATCAVGAWAAVPGEASATPGAPGIGTLAPDLAALQLTSADVAPIVKWPPDPPSELTVYKTQTEPIAGSAGTSDAQCAGAVYAGLDSTYDGSGFTGLNYQELTGFGAGVSYSVVSVASSFDDEHAAANMVAKTIQSWSDCNRRKVTGDLGGTTETRTVNNLVTAPDSIYVINNITDGGDGACSHAMASQRNVVVEVSACRSNIGLAKQGLQLANKMLVKLPA